MQVNNIQSTNFNGIKPGNGMKEFLMKRSEEETKKLLDLAKEMKNYKYFDILVDEKGYGIKMRGAANLYRDTFEPQVRFGDSVIIKTKHQKLDGRLENFDAFINTQSKESANAIFEEIKKTPDGSLDRIATVTRWLELYKSKAVEKKIAEENALKEKNNLIDSLIDSCKQYEI